MGNFKIELENIIESNDTRKDINMIYTLARLHRSLDTLYKGIKKLELFSDIIFGKSGSHLWVSYPNGSRILLITAL